MLGPPAAGTGAWVAGVTRGAGASSPAQAAARRAPASIASRRLQSVAIERAPDMQGINAVRGRWGLVRTTRTPWAPGWR